MNGLITSGVSRLSCFFLLVVCLTCAAIENSVAQEIKYEDRMGSNKDFDMCEDFRFKRITKLVTDGSITQEQGYNIWKRIQSDKEAVSNVLNKSVAAGELTKDQVARLLPLLDMKVIFVEGKHGWFGTPKKLEKGAFKPGEVSAEHRNAVYQRLIAANAKGDMYDYDVASIMNQLYAGFDEGNASVEEVAIYRGALNPRIAQSGSQTRVLQMARMQRQQTRSKGYGVGEIKIAEPADWIKNLEKPIYSGPQPGEKLPALSVANLRGDQTGQEIDPIAMADGKLHLMFFVSKSRTFGRFLGQLRNQLQAIEEKSKQPWAMSVIVCSDDANEVEKSFTVLNQRYPKNLIVGLCKDGAAGPPAYGLDKNLTATVIVVKDGKVVHNLPYAGDAFYTQPHILGAVASAMEVDHQTLRNYIGGKPGDAVTQANRRRMQNNSGTSNNTPEKGFRKKLVPLVADEKITRTEASELLRASADKATLRKKIEDLLKAGKLTRADAKELLTPSQTDETQPLKMDSVRCPVMPSRVVKSDLSVTFQGAKVFFCCKNCQAKFKADPQKYEEAAKQQIAATGQRSLTRKR